MKTVYLVTTRAFGGSSIPIAFECPDCAETQAAWYRRAKVQAQVILIHVHEHMRSAFADKSHNPMEPAKPRAKDPVCVHTPVTVNA